MDLEKVYIDFKRPLNYILMFTNDIWQEKTIEFLVYGEIVRSEIIAKLTIGNIEIVNCWPYLVVVYNGTRALAPRCVHVK